MAGFLCPAGPPEKHFLAEVYRPPIGSSVPARLAPCQGIASAGRSSSAEITGCPRRLDRVRGKSPGKQPLAAPVLSGKPPDRRGNVAGEN